MSTELKPGDRVYFVQKDRKLRGVVSDTLNLKARGEALLVPVIRPRKSSKPTTVHADHDHKPKELKTRWMERSKLRKLPD